jgi:hypothetical protein
VYCSKVNKEHPLSSFADWENEVMVTRGMTFATENSLYEVDLAASRIRRLAGKENPTPRQGEDGEWKTFFGISEVMIGQTVLIAWPPLTGKSTSSVTKIEHQSDK